MHWKQRRGIQKTATRLGKWIYEQSIVTKIAKTRPKADQQSVRTTWTLTFLVHRWRKISRVESTWSLSRKSLPFFWKWNQEKKTRNETKLRNGPCVDVILTSRYDSTVVRQVRGDRIRNEEQFVICGNYVRNISKPNYFPGIARDSHRSRNME
jgi:hypothetical protein